MIASLAARQESFEQTLDALERDLFGHSDRARRAADFRRSIEERLHQIERLQESGRAVPDDAWSDIPDEAPGLDERIGEAFATGEDWRTALTTIPDPPLPVVNDSPAPKEAVDSATELPTTGPWRDGVTGLIEFPGRAGRSTFESPPRSLESLVASLEGTSGASFRRESVGGAIEGILGEPSPLSPGAWLRSPPFAVTTERALASTNLPSVTATDAASIEQLEDDLWDWADPKNLWRLTWPFRGSRALRGIWIYGSGLIDRFSSLFDFSLKELTDDSR